MLKTKNMGLECERQRRNMSNPNYWPNTVDGCLLTDSLIGSKKNTWSPRHKRLQQKPTWNHT